MTADLLAGLPLFALLAGAPAVYLEARLSRGRGGEWTGLGAFAVFLLSFGLAVGLLASGSDGPVPFLGAMTLAGTPLAYFLATIGTGLGMAASLFSIPTLRGDRSVERYFPLLLLMAAGAVGLGFAADLFGLFVFFELMAVASYGLVAYHVDRAEAIEAGMKYVVLSGAGSLVALLGISFAYLGAGTTDLAEIRGASAGMPVLLAGPAAALFVAGFGLKAAIVPMHTWLPDAHTAAPSGISAMLSGIVIEAALVALATSVGAVATPAVSVGLYLSLLAVLTMTVGNLLALHQSDVKRMLAYSSVAQVGYILLGFGLAFEFGVAGGAEGGLLHILTHGLAKGGAFLAAGAFVWIAGTRDLGQLAGIGRAAPAVGLSFALFALGLAGVPPMGGFLSKLLIAKAGLDAGGLGPILLVLALAANSVLSLGYYVPALLRIVFSEARPARVRVPWTMQGPIVGLALATVLIGLFPDPAIQAAQAAAQGLARAFGGA